MPCSALLALTGRCLQPGQLLAPLVLQAPSPLTECNASHAWRVATMEQLVQAPVSHALQAPTVHRTVLLRVWHVLVGMCLKTEQLLAPHALLENSPTI